MINTVILQANAFHKELLISSFNLCKNFLLMYVQLNLY